MIAGGVVSRKAGTPSHAGFTLIELLVVMALIAIIASAGGVISSNYLVRRRVEQYAAGIVQDLRAAQADAIFKRTSRTVEFDTTANSYRYQGTSGAYVVPVQLRGGVEIQSVAFGATNATSVSFTPFGEPSPGGGTVVITGSSGLTVWVNVSLVLGRVSMEWK